MRKLIILILNSDPAKQGKTQSLWTWNTEMVINLFSEHFCQTLTSPHTFFITQKTSGVQLSPLLLSTCCLIPAPPCLFFLLLGEENAKSNMRMSVRQKPGVATLDPHYSFVREDRLEIIPILLKQRKRCFKNYLEVNGRQKIWA